MFDGIEEIKKTSTSTTYLTHSFHPYPAKFIPQIPNFFINKFSSEGDVILDPFVGCGTTLVESAISNRESIGVDLNPIAALISRTKSSKLSTNQMKLIDNFKKNIRLRIHDHYKNGEDLKVTNQFPNIDHWFQVNVQKELTLITDEISKIKDEKSSDFIKTALSSIIVNVSNQDSDTRYVAKNKHIENYKTQELLFSKITSMTERIKEFNKVCSNSNVNVYNRDSSNLDFIKNNSVDLVITSPPYANTYDYYLYHKLRMYWLGYDVSNVKKKEIGSRDKHSSQRKDIDDFNFKIKECFIEVQKKLKAQKHLVVIIGDSVIRKELYNAKDMMISIGDEIGLKFLYSSSENLKKTTRMFNPNFTNSQKDEHIMVFKNIKNDL